MSKLGGCDSLNMTAPEPNTKGDDRKGGTTEKENLTTLLSLNLKLSVRAGASSRPN